MYSNRLKHRRIWGTLCCRVTERRNREKCQRHVGKKDWKSCRPSRTATDLDNDVDSSVIYLPLPARSNNANVWQKTANSSKRRPPYMPDTHTHTHDFSGTKNFQAFLLLSASQWGDLVSPALAQAPLVLPHTLGFATMTHLLLTPTHSASVAIATWIHALHLHEVCVVVVKRKTVHVRQHEGEIEILFSSHCPRWVTHVSRLLLCSANVSMSMSQKSAHPVALIFCEDKYIDYLFQPLGLKKSY